MLRNVLSSVLSSVGFGGPATDVQEQDQEIIDDDMTEADNDEVINEDPVTL